VTLHAAPLEQRADLAAESSRRQDAWQPSQKQQEAPHGCPAFPARTGRAKGSAGRPEALRSVTAGSIQSAHA